MFSTLSKKLPYSIRGLVNFEVELLFLKERKALKSFSKASTSLTNIYVYIYIYIYIYIYALPQQDKTCVGHITIKILKCRDLDSI